MSIRTRNLYSSESEKPFKLSRSKVDLFLTCPRCFYIDRKLGVGQPPGFPFNINSAVDELLKKEFDIYRSKGKPHPYMLDTGKNLIPFSHEELDEWRENFKGVQFLHKVTNFLLTGAVDDVWYDLDKEELVVVDYKATSKNDEVSLDADWQISYKRQMDFYQWLFRNNGFNVSEDGYFVYCNGDKSKSKFNEKVEFKVSILKYTGSTDWVEPTIFEIKNTLDSTNLPDSSKECNFCIYIEDVNQVKSI